MMCAINGRARFYKLSGAFPGAVPLELPGLGFLNVGAETSTQSISPAKSVAKKDNILYFGVFKTDKSGIYALGQLDSDKPEALILSKRFHTTDYSLHKPTAVFTQGPNFYAAFVDNTTASTMRCESNNSPTRSSNAVYESLILDLGNPLVHKTLDMLYVATYPLAASTSVSTAVATNYSSSYTTLTRADGTAMNGTNDTVGVFNGNNYKGKVHRIKVSLASSTTNSPKVTAIMPSFNMHKEPANN